MVGQVASRGKCLKSIVFILTLKTKEKYRNNKSKKEFELKYTRKQFFLISALRRTVGSILKSFSDK